MMRLGDPFRVAVLKARVAHGGCMVAAASSGLRNVAGAAPSAPSNQDSQVSTEKMNLGESQKRNIWPVIAAVTGVGAGVAAVAVYSPQTLGLPAPGPSPEEIAAAEAAEAEERRLAEERAREEAALQALHAELARQEAEAARKAAEEAKAAAEEAAAAAANRERLRETVELALVNVVSPGARAEDVEELRSALQEARSAMVSADALGITEAKARLEELDRAEALRADLKTSAEMLEESMSTRVTQDCCTALAQIAAAEAELDALGEADRADIGLLQRGQQELAEMERLDQELARRAEAETSLNAAVRAREPEACRVALEEARSAGVAPSPAMELAEVLSNPDRLHRVLASEGADRILEDRRGLPGFEGRTAGLDVEDFAAAAAASAAVLGREELQERAAELAKALVQTHSLRAREMEKELETVEAELRERMAAKVGQSLQHFNEEHNRSLAEKENQIRSMWDERTQEAVAVVQAEADAEANKRREVQMQEAEATMTERILSAREDFNRRYSALEEPLKALNKLMGQGMTLHQRSQASSMLASAMLALQGSLLEGRTSHSELRTLQTVGTTDTFVASLLRLLPAEAVESSKEPVPTTLQLARSFQEQVSDFQSGAFAMPGRGGIFMASMSGIVSRIFSRLYVLKQGEVDGAGDSDVRKNLDILTKASKFVERGEVREALDMMEASLTGECRDRASRWMSEARNALLLHQAARALQAKARCLNAILS